MSFNELIAELTKLSSEQRDLVRIRLAELAGEEWMDDGELSLEDKRLVDERLAEHERNPESAIPWSVMEAKLRARYGL